MVRKAVPKDPEMDSQLAWKALLDRVNQLLVPDFFFGTGAVKQEGIFFFGTWAPLSRMLRGKPRT